MTITTSTVTTITMTTDDLPFDAVLDFEPCEWIDPVVTPRADGSFTVAYAVQDSDGWSESPIEDSDGINFREFTSAWGRDEWVSEQDDTDHVFIVNHYEHGASVYTVAGSARTVLDPGGFDTRPSCVLVLAPDFTDPATAAEAIMAEYTSWANGDVYGIVRQDFAADGTETLNESVWGFIGTEYAESVVADIDANL